MEIKGKIFCLFEQSGTFKKEFRKLGYMAEDYDIQNEYGETDHVCDLFAEINAAYDGAPSLFDQITPDDLAIAFFPCIYFSCLSQMAMRYSYINYKKLDIKGKTDAITARIKKRDEFLTLLLKLFAVMDMRGGAAYC